MSAYDLIETIWVKSKEHDGAVVKINKSDFNPDIHTKTSAAESKKAEEGNVAPPNPKLKDVDAGVDIVPPGSANSTQAASREDAIKKLEKEDPELAKKAREGGADEDHEAEEDEDDDEESDDDDAKAKKAKGGSHRRQR